MAKTKKKKRTNKRKKKNTGHQGALILSMLIALILVCGFGVYLLLTPPAEKEPPTETIPPVMTPQPTLPPSTLIADAFGYENGYKSYITPSLTADFGLDVSSHQGWIDWNAVKESGVDYVILRAGYRGYNDGHLYEDEYFSYNLESCIAAGLDVGIYYFSQAITPEEAKEEANHTLKLLGDYAPEYPIFYDWEPVTDAVARTDTITMSEVTACAKTFCETIEKAGHEAGVYFNLSMASGYYYLYDLMGYDFWLAEYAEIPSFPHTIQLWQYTSEGSVPGISTTVDMNLSFKPYGS